MAKEWTDEEVQKEIAEAVRIVREDRFETFVRGRLSPPANDPSNPPTAPPNSGGDNPTPPEKKSKSLWWGDTE